MGATESSVPDDFFELLGFLYRLLEFAVLRVESREPFRVSLVLFDLVLVCWELKSRDLLRVLEVSVANPRLKRLLTLPD